MDPPAPTELLHSDCAGRIFGAFFHVYNELGLGLVERAYCRALHVELDRRGCNALPQRKLEIRYGAEKPIRFRADFVVAGRVVVEIKARSCLLQGHLNIRAWSGVMSMTDSPNGIPRNRSIPLAGKSLAARGDSLPMRC